MAWACTTTSRGPMECDAQPSPFCPECRSNGCCEWAELQRVVGPASPCRPYDDGIDDTRRVKAAAHVYPGGRLTSRSEEHTSELQSLMRISYAVLCLKKKNQNNTHRGNTTMTTTAYTQ